MGKDAERGKLEVYRSLVLRWNRRIALVSRRTPEASLERLISHALEAEEVLPREFGFLIDVGSGAGIPGIPLALRRPSMQVMLVERSRNKCIFLREVKRILELENVEVVEAEFTPAMLEGRSETAVTALALGDYARLARTCSPVMREGDGMLLFVARNLAEEIASAEGFLLKGWRGLSGRDRTGAAWLAKGCKG
jgi:16S rRNA (guanine527-N7)-methyltransferase